ncbi:MAG: flavin reductase family protein [Chloroflexi bacterium]|nr:flavin reductase family protein [Chloroflexota bacterium]MBI3764424.1 flavin reductase family protein [Chloroflexota bacterium]
MPVDSETLRTALRGWASGVTIVTARAGGETHGMTVSSFTSVSLDPPLVLVCIEQSTRTHRLIQASGAFAVSVLNESQGEWSDRFGGRDSDGRERFEGVATFAALTGAPILGDGVAYFDCVIQEKHPAGNHTIFVGQVVAAKLANGRAPLVYWKQAYRKIAS